RAAAGRARRAGPRAAARRRGAAPAAPAFRDRNRRRGRAGRASGRGRWARPARRRPRSGRPAGRGGARLTLPWSRVRLAIPARCIAAALAIAYVAPLFLGETLCLRDHLTFFAPSWRHLSSALAAGRLPEWWGGVGLGVAFAANPLHAVTY